MLKKGIFAPLKKIFVILIGKIKIHMPVYLPKEKVQEIFKTHSGSATNTGDTQGQIALFTFRIEQLSAHLQTNKKDHACRRQLLTLVGKRKRLLTYLQNKNIATYRELIAKLNIRK
jgi:small subunit ribosomal protein S15